MKSKLTYTSETREGIQTPGFTSHKKPVGKRAILWQWWAEITVLLCACGLLGAIFGVIYRNRDQEVALWTLSGMSLNTFIAVLSALLRALVITIAEEVISQHKWIWQLRPRPASHLSFIDQASRGLWGSIILPVRIRAWFSYIYIGCLIMLLSLGIGPFAQQASGTHICVKPIAGSSATISWSWAGPHSFKSGSMRSVDTGFTEAIVRASTNSSLASTAVLLQGCTSGNCSFPHHLGIALSTLGVCSRCIDTTRYVRPDKDGNVALPGVASSKSVGWGTRAIVSNYSTNLEWAQADFTDDLRDSFRASISNYTFLGMTSVGCDVGNGTTRVKDCTNRPSAIPDDVIEDFNVYSAVCTFYFCMRHHSVNVTNNALTETLVADSPGFLDPQGLNTPGYRKYLVWQPTCKVGSEALDLTSARTRSFGNESARVELTGPGTPRTVDISWSANCTAYAREFGKLAISESLQILRGYCGYQTGGTSPVNLALRTELLLCVPWNIYGLWNDGLASFSTTSAAMARIAAAISDRMREIAAKKNFQISDAADPDPDVKGGYIMGDVNQTAICTRFQWEWLLGPLLLLLVTAGFLVQAITRSVVRREREPLWKSSILPALYLSSESQGQGSKHEMSELDKRAEKSIVVLSRMSEGKWELVDKAGRSGRSDEGDEDSTALMDLPASAREDLEDIPTEQDQDTATSSIELIGIETSEGNPRAENRDSLVGIRRNMTR